TSSSSRTAMWSRICFSCCRNVSTEEESISRCARAAMRSTSFVSIDTSPSSRTSKAITLELRGHLEAVSRGGLSGHDGDGGHGAARREDAGLAAHHDLLGVLTL